MFNIACSPINRIRISTVYIPSDFFIFYFAKLEIRNYLFLSLEFGIYF